MKSEFHTQGKHTKNKIRISSRGKENAGGAGKRDAGRRNTALFG